MSDSQQREVVGERRAADVVVDSLLDPIEQCSGSGAGLREEGQEPLLRKEGSLGVAGLGDAVGVGQQHLTGGQFDSAHRKAGARQEAQGGTGRHQFRSQPVGGDHHRR